MRLPKSPGERRKSHPVRQTNGEECVRRKRVNHNVPWKCPPKGRSGDFRPISGQGGWRHERGPRAIVTARRLERRRVGADSGTVTVRPHSIHSGKNVTRARKSTVNFSLYLSDLLCPFATRIGALGYGRPIPDDSGAALLGFAGVWGPRGVAEGLWLRQSAISSVRVTSPMAR